MPRGCTPARIRCIGHTDPRCVPGRPLGSPQCPRPQVPTPSARGGPACRRHRHRRPAPAGPPAASAVLRLLVIIRILHAPSRRK
jgi:hypothetical protein